MQCGEEGYPLRYGYKYCQRFAERSRHFNNKVSLYVPCSCTSLFVIIYVQDMGGMLIANAMHVSKIRNPERNI